MILLNPAVRYLHFCAFFEVGRGNRVSGIIFYQFFFDIIKIQTFLNHKVDMSRNLSDEIDENKLEKQKQANFFKVKIWSDLKKN